SSAVMAIRGTSVANSHVKETHFQRGHPLGVVTLSIQRMLVGRFLVTCTWITTGVFARASLLHFAYSRKDDFVPYWQPLRRANPCPNPVTRLLSRKTVRTLSGCWSASIRRLGRRPPWSEPCSPNCCGGRCAAASCVSATKCMATYRTR